MRNKITGFVRRIEQATIVRGIREGLVNLIPVLTIGAFALIVNTLPIQPYQDFIQNFANGFIVLAEFVETEEQRELLYGMGCEYYQGYLYSPAVFLKTV